MLRCRAVSSLPTCGEGWGGVHLLQKTYFTVYLLLPRLKINPPNLFISSVTRA